MKKASWSKKVGKLESWKVGKEFLMLITLAKR
jgi:hypothetical protein